MTRNIQRVEKQGLVKRSKNLSDKRSIKLNLSIRGTKLVKNLNNDIYQNLKPILQKYDFDKIEQIQSALELLGWDLYLYRKDL